MKVLLVNPALSAKFPNGRDLIHDADLVHVPIGLLHLAAVATENEHQVRIVDMPVGELSIEDYQAVLDEFRPRLVGITTMTATFVNAMECARRAKAAGCQVVMGGAHVTFEYEDVLRAGLCDIVIRGEGEVGFEALLNALEADTDFEKVPGSVFLDGRGQLVRVPAAPRIRDLDARSHLDYDLLDMPRYVEIEALGAHSSRGCPYTCDFCTIQAQWGRKVTYISPDRVADEVQYLIERYDYENKEFIFYDDTFTVYRSHVLELCDEIGRRDLRFRWKAMTRVDRVDPELLAAMRAAGCFQVTYGIESTEEESLKQMGKGQHFDQVISAITMAKAEGMQVAGYFIIGFPWETKADMQRVVDKMGELDLDTYGLAMLAPYPGTPYYDTPERWGLTIPDPDWQRFNHLLPVIETPNFTRRDQAEVFADYLCRYVLK